MDQAFKQSEEYRSKSKVLSNVSRVTFVTSLVLSAIAVFIPFLLLAFTFIVPVALALILVTGTLAVVYRFKARKAIRAVLTVPDPYLQKEQTQDVATLIVLFLIAGIVAYVFANYLINLFKSFS